MERLSARSAFDNESKFNVSKLHSGAVVLVVTVVSDRWQTNGPEQQWHDLKQVCRERGLEIAGRFDYEGQRYKPEWIIPIVAKAKRKGADYLLFWSPCRALRHPEFKAGVKGKCHLQATPAQWRELFKHTDGIPIVFVHEPESVRSERGKKGGRPPKKTYKTTAKLPKATRLEIRHLRAKGHTIREIADRLGLEKSSVHRYLTKIPASWIKQYAQFS